MIRRIALAPSRELRLSIGQRMKRLVATLVSLAWLAMTPGVLALHMMGKAVSVQPPDACCHHSAEHAPASPPAIPACCQCCLLCGVIHAKVGDGIATPVARTIKWQIEEMNAPLRTERPPLPPPRVG
jgi:hypothetical protein